MAVDGTCDFNYMQWTVDSPLFFPASLVIVPTETSLFSFSAPSSYPRPTPTTSTFNKKNVLDFDCYSHLVMQQVFQAVTESAGCFFLIQILYRYCQAFVFCLAVMLGICQVNERPAFVIVDVGKPAHLVNKPDVLLPCKKLRYLSSFFK